MRNVKDRVTGMEKEDQGPVIEVINEFATVTVKKVWTRNGARLEISSPRLGCSIRLDALALESLTWQSMETFTRFLETPFGPLEQDAGPAGKV